MLRARRLPETLIAALAVCLCGTGAGSQDSGTAAEVWTAGRGKDRAKINANPSVVPFARKLPVVPLLKDQRLRATLLISPSARPTTTTPA